MSDARDGRPGPGMTSGKSGCERGARGVAMAAHRYAMVRRRVVEYLVILRVAREAKVQKNEVAGWVLGGYCCRLVSIAPPIVSTCVLRLYLSPFPSFGLVAPLKMPMILHLFVCCASVQLVERLTKDPPARTEVKFIQSNSHAHDCVGMFVYPCQSTNRLVFP